MKIALVLDDTLDTPDGVQQYVLRVSEWLQRQGHEVHYLVGETKRTDLPNIHSLARNVQVRFNGNHMSVPLPTGRRRLKRFLAEQRYDILHVQVPYSPFMSGQLLAVVPNNCAVIGTFHILPYSATVTAANRCLSLLNHHSAKRFDRMLAVSKPAAAFARSVYNYDCMEIPNPINLQQFTDSVSNDHHTNIVFLGRLVERKGAGYLLRAVAALKADNRLLPDVRVKIGGKGPLSGELQRYVIEQGLQQQVSFEGFVDETRKADYLAQADIAVYPSLGGESFGIVLLEAMAAARGVVLAGDNPGYRSVMPDASHLLDPTDTAGFADRLHSWLNDPGIRRKAAKQQRAYVTRFDVGVVGQALLDVYEDALQSRRKS